MRTLASYRKHLIRLLLLAALLVAGIGIAARPVAADCAELPSGLGAADFTVSVPKDDSYRFWIRMYSPSAGSDSLYLQVDDSRCKEVVGDAAMPAERFTWVDYGAGRTDNKLNLTLSEGSHKFRLAGLDPKVGADMVLLLNSECVPSGDGGNCSSLPAAVEPQPQTTEEQGFLVLIAKDSEKQFPLLFMLALTALLAAVAALAYVKWEHTHKIAHHVRSKVLRKPFTLLPPEPAHAVQVRLVVVIVSATALAVVWTLAVLYTALAAPSTPGYALSNATLSSGAKVVEHADAIGDKMIQFSTAPVGSSAGGGGSGSAGGGSSGGSSGGGSSGGGGSAGTGKNCANSPHTCGYPDATNTGWQHTGVALSVVNDDPFYITTPGAVIDAKDIRGCVFVMAPNVTIKRSKITCSNQPMVKTYEPDGQGGLDDLAPGLVIEDVEFDGMGDVDSTGIAFNSYTIRRSNFHNIGSAARIGSNVVAEDNYVHSIASNTSSHNGGFPFDGGSNNTIRHNTIFMTSTNGYALSIYNQVPAGNVVSNVLVENNLLAGGNYIMYCGAPGQITPNLRVLNNRFSKIIYPNGGWYGVTANCNGPTAWSGNIWDHDLSTVNP